MAARMELGPEYTEYVAASLAERVEDLAARARRRASAAGRARQPRAGRRAERPQRQTALAIVSMVMGIPITGISCHPKSTQAIVGVAISWAGIVGVNWIHARSIRKRK